MILPLQKFSVLMENMAAAVQGGSTQLVDLSIGSVLRALLEASAASALWMQWLILQVLSVTRAATSTGVDLDSWMADFQLVRLAGVSSSGIVQFSRYTAGRSTVVPVGTVVSTSDGTQSFTVVADTSNPAWNGVGGYQLSAAAVSVSAPVLAVLPGLAGNIQAGAVGLLAVALPGVDTVSNQTPFGGGADAESDVALRARFQLYINSRSLATPIAIAFAVASVQLGLRYAVIENSDTSGNFLPGSFWVVVDDGTGSAPDSLITAVSLAVAGVRPIGSMYAVTRPTVQTIVVQMNVATSNLLTRPAVLATIENTVFAWIASLPVAGTLAVSKIEALAHNADPSVISVSGASINGASLDVTASESGILLATSVIAS